MDKALEQLAEQAIDDNEAWLVLCDAVEELGADGWLLCTVAKTVFGAWSSRRWGPSRPVTAQMLTEYFKKWRREIQKGIRAQSRTFPYT